MKGLSKLILGCAYIVKREHKLAITSYRDCLSERNNIPKNSDDAHVSAFAQYELGALLIRSDEVNIFILTHTVEVLPGFIDSQST